MNESEFMLSNHKLISLLVSCDYSPLVSSKTRKTMYQTNVDFERLKVLDRGKTVLVINEEQDISCPTRHPSGTSTSLRFYRASSSVVQQMPWRNLQRWGTACTLPKLTVLFCVLFVCKYVLYYCHWVSTQLQLTNISNWSHSKLRSSFGCFWLLAILISFGWYPECMFRHLIIIILYRWPICLPVLTYWKYVHLLSISCVSY